MLAVLLKVLSNVGLKLLSERFAVPVFLHIGEWLVAQTKNDLDDKLMAEVRKCLEEE